MAMMFPGMDPYLEQPQLWPDVHASFMVYLREYLRPLLHPRYIVSIEARVFVEGSDLEHGMIPDASIRHARPEPSQGSVVLLEADPMVEVVALPLEIEETYLTIRHRQAQQQIVTVLELVSPTNKYAGPGRDSYITKQREVRRSTAHLVEIDLLRHGPHVLAVPEELVHQQQPYDYLVCVNRAAAWRGRFQLYPRRLRDRLPRIRLPLTVPDPDVVLDLQAVLVRTYEAGGYEDVLDYSAPCVPPLSAEDQRWADALIRESLGQDPLG